MMGSGGGGGSTVKQNTVTELPQWAIPYAQGSIGKAYDFSQQPYQQYPDTRIVPYTANQQEGLGLTADFARNNPITNAANQLSVDTLSGKYLGQENPAWAPMAQRIKDAYQQGTAAQTDAAFSRAGAFGLGNSAYGEQLQQNQRTYGDSLANLAGQLYNTERQNQMATLGMVPQTSAANYSNYSALIGTGDAQRQYEQDIANQNYADWYNKMMYPQTSVQNFANLFPALMGNAGSSTATGPNPNQISPIAAGIGGGLLGYGAGSAAASAGLMGAEITPYAPWIGAGIGALGGYLLSK